MALEITDSVIHAVPIQSESLPGRGVSQDQIGVSYDSMTLRDIHTLGLSEHESVGFMRQGLEVFLQLLLPWVTQRQFNLVSNHKTMCSKNSPAERQRTQDP